MFALNIEGNSVLYIGATTKGNQRNFCIMKIVYVLFHLYVNAAYDHGSKDIEKDTKNLGFL